MENFKTRFSPIFLSHIFLSDLLLVSLFPSFPYSLLISDSFKVPFALPIGHRGIERRLFRAEEMRVMLDHVFAEGAPGEFARRESVRGFGQRVWHARQIFCGVDVADEAFGRLDLVDYPVQSRSQRSCEGQVRITIGARDSAFDAQ